MNKVIPFFILCILVAPLRLTALEDFPLPQKLDKKGFAEVFAESGCIYFSGQPDKNSFSDLKDMGVTTVINLRTLREMDDRRSVPFDEKRIVQGLGMDYVHIPVGGSDNPYTKEALEKFKDAFEKAKGRVLLHCSVAYRASHMWAAYLIKYKNYSSEKALEHARAVNFGELPVEGFLEKQAVIIFR